MISIGGHLTILESVDSTNNYAMARVRTGMAKHGDAFFAMAQLAGKGQRGKTWITDPGTNIIITLVIQPEGLAIAQQFQFSMAMALAANDFYAHYAGDETFVKWPNDIYWRDRKAGGILIENIIASADTVQGNWQWAIVGMGININQTVFPDTARNAVSLKQVTGKHWDVIALAKELCSHVQRRYEQLVNGIPLLSLYNELLYKKGQVVKFRNGSRVFEGCVKEVNSWGELVIVTATEECFRVGEIEWIA